MSGREGKQTEGRGSWTGLSEIVGRIKRGRRISLEYKMTRNKEMRG